jgi:hypothetical protein
MPIYTKHVYLFTNPLSPKLNMFLFDAASITLLKYISHFIYSFFNTRSLSKIDLLRIKGHHVFPRELLRFLSRAMVLINAKDACSHLETCITSSKINYPGHAII